MTQRARAAVAAARWAWREVGAAQRWATRWGLDPEAVAEGWARTWLGATTLRR